MEPRLARYTYAFDAPPQLPRDELTRLLGGKGANLVIMATTLGLPVPPGFVISTEACASVLRGDTPAGLRDEIRAQVEQLATRIGRRFGDEADPLLVSVRSGAPVSMPGMMDTVLNLGLTRGGVDGLAAATGDRAFAADCLRRLGEGYRGVIGSDDVPDDPWLQLDAAIDAVFQSWNSVRARAYRQRETIADDLGTAVTVQAMVFGNRGADSGTGVAFTRNPSTGEPELYGDVMFEAQGEDVVAGGMQPQPLAALADRLPDVAAELRRHAELLERHYADLCDIEFTIEEGRLWLLQVRAGKRSPGAALRIAVDMATDPSFPLTREEAVHRVAHLLADPPRVLVEDRDRPAPLTTGLAASPGIASGEIATSPAEAIRRADEGKPIILVRSETSPEDVPGMSRAAGVLTARGGLASHAAVVARGWGIPAVVGAADIRLVDCGVAIGDRRLAAGATITIDGGTGEVLAGEVTGHWETAPEAATLLEWAAAAGIEIADGEVTPGPDATPADDAGSADGDVPLDQDDLVRLLLVKGSATTEQLAAALAAHPGALEAAAADLVDGGLSNFADGALSLTSEGRLRAVDAFGAEREQLGTERCGQLLEAFHALDGRMKAIVTAWQLREIDGEHALNDHTDAAYDGAVLADLATLHADTAAWLAGVASSVARYQRYVARLGAALELARGGDQRFVASPRVDSYHGVWFELHEDLIRLAGRRRSDEAAAGRA